MANIVSPGNSFIRQVLLQQVDPSTGVLSPLTTGTLNGFIGATQTSTAGADASFTVAGVYIGGANGYVAGTWQFSIPGSTLTAAKCAAVFADGQPCYFIVVDTDGSVRAIQVQVFRAFRTMVNA